MNRIYGLFDEVEHASPLFKHFGDDLDAFHILKNDIVNNLRKLRSDFDFPFTFAFQPIIDASARTVFGYEALVRGVNGESAEEILSSVSSEDMKAFDLIGRYEAIKLASKLNIGDKVLSINFNPNASGLDQNCILTTLLAAEKFGLSETNIMFEVTGDDKCLNRQQLQEQLSRYSELGLRIAVNDFGEGHGGMNLLLETLPDMVKLDGSLIRNIHKDKNRQIVVKNLVQMLLDLGVHPVVKGVESKEEMMFFPFYWRTAFSRVFHRRAGT